MRETKSRSVERGPSSAAHFYGLNEIPFEPTGAAAGKYSYVPPREFSVVEDIIRDIVSEKKLYVMLLKAPQGGGKTATTDELKKRAESGKYASAPVTVVANRLLDLDIRHYAADFIAQARQGSVSEYAKKFSIGSKTTPSECKNALESTLKHAGANSNLVLWVIDEFDILVDRPREEQSSFLQFIREIVDNLAGENFPIMFLMCHTVKSSKEFEQSLREAHGPMHSRIVTALELSYTFEETLEIVCTRLASVSMKPRHARDTAPFTENSLKLLYDLVVSTGATGELNDFRLFERCCFVSILQGARSKSKEIGKELASKIFGSLYKAAPSETPAKQRLSTQTRTEIAQVIRQSQMVRNEAIFNGIIKGLDLMKTQISEVNDVVTDQRAEIAPDIHISSLEYTAKHRGSGKQIHTLWILAARQKGMILQDDLGKIANRVLKIINEREWHPNVTIFSYISDLDLDTSALAFFDEKFKISTETARNLVMMGVASEDDVRKLRSSFDSDLAPELGDIYSTRARDVTKKVPDPVIQLVKALNIFQLAGAKVTRGSLRVEEKNLFFKETKIGDRHLSDLVELGFADEQSGEIKPRIPRAIMRLLEMVEKHSKPSSEVSSEFGDNGDFVVAAAEKLALIESSETSVRKTQLSELESNSSGLVSRCSTLMKDRAMASTFAGKRLRMLLDAAKGCKSNVPEFQKIVVLATINQLLPEILANLESQKIEPAAQPQAAIAVTVGPQATVTVPTREIRPVATGTKIDEKFEGDIKKCLEDNALTLAQLETKLKSLGYAGDVRNRVLGMILRNQLKLSLSSD